MKTIAIVTGASSGIGKEFFLSLKNQKPVDEIWVVARGEEKLKALQAQPSSSLLVSRDALASQIYVFCS